jgi:hypothetical protein
VLLTICPARPSRDPDDTRAALIAAGLPVFTGQNTPGGRTISGQPWRVVWSARPAPHGAAEFAAAYETIGDELVEILKGRTWKHNQIDMTGGARL